MITNKQDCMDFIYHHEMMAKNRVNAKYNKLIEEKKKEILSPYADKIGLMQYKINGLSSEIINLLTDMKLDKNVQFVPPSWEDLMLNKIASGKWTDEIINRCKFDGEIQKLRDMANKEKIAIDREYEKIYAVVKPIRSAKKIIAILDELGFDTKSLKNNEKSVALVPKVDKEILGI